MADLIATDFTSTTHRTAYASISPTRPALSQADRTILITGGGTGIGKSIAEHFLLASAARVIIAGRRGDVLDAAVAELRAKAHEAGKDGLVLSKRVDVTSKSEVAALWEGLKSEGVNVDVLVLNAAKFSEPRPLLDLGADEIWSQVEANFYGPLVLTEGFMKQNEGTQKFLINVTSAVIHGQKHPMVIPRAAYALSKSAGTLFVQLLSDQIPPEQLQVITMHPGTVFGAGYEAAGITRDMLPFDEVDLPGAFAVWAASKEAAFANGRVLWAAWDVDELAGGDVGRRIREDENYLRINVVGTNLWLRDAAYK